MPPRLAAGVLALTIPAAAHASSDLADSINELGLDLLRARATTQPPGNQLLSPYSIQAALAMAYAGAEGTTRDEMQRVLHLKGDANQVAQGFSDLADSLSDLQARSRASAEAAMAHGDRQDAITLNTANGLFVQAGFALRPAFTALLRDEFKAPLRELDFHHTPEPSRNAINAWVAGETHDRITSLIPPGVIDDRTRTVLANAVYLKAPWAEPFEKHATRQEPFWLDADTRIDVPTMYQRERLGYQKRTGHVVVLLPYVGGDLQLVVLLPDTRDGLDALEKALTADHLADSARLKRHDVIVHLPKLKMEPPVLQLGETLRNLGMTTAFDHPRRSANFDRMAPRTPEDYLAISEVVHRTWLELDENGTEAAAATAAVMVAAASVPAHPPPPPIEVRIDRPFLFAIQHVSSGACLFLGRVTDPR